MSKENNLESLRRRIDEIDLRLLDLINERVRTATEIGADKAARGEKVYRPEREAGEERADSFSATRACSF